MTRARFLFAGLVAALLATSGAAWAEPRHERPSFEQPSFERPDFRREMRPPEARAYAPEPRSYPPPPPRGGRESGARPPPRGDYSRAPPAMPRPNSLGAGWREQQEEARTGVRQGQMAPLGQVIEGLQRRSPGRQLDSGIEYQDGRAVYRVRWMTNHGRRIDYLVDAATGTILDAR